MHDNLTKTLAVAIADDSINRIVLQNTDPSFCNSSNLNEFDDFPNPTTSHVIHLTRSPTHLITHLSPRIIIHTHGSCINAGAKLPTFTKRVVTQPDTRFTL